MLTRTRIEQLIEKGQEVLKHREPDYPNVIAPSTVDNQKFYAWHIQALQYLSDNLSPDNIYLQSFRDKASKNYPSQVENGIGILESIKEDLDLNLISADSNCDNNDYESLINIFEKFHSLVRQLRIRRENRETLNVSDEYDVQDLIHVLLKLFFDDIRTEEWTPSYAGSSSRMDFLLKEKGIVIEIKKTRSSLGPKELGAQLIEDIAKYKSHPDCKVLICFVYDPEAFIGNPKGIENDLSSNESQLPVKVIIRP